MSTIPVRTQEAARTDGLRRLATIFHASDMVWLVEASYDAYTQLWHFDMLRQGAQGSWVIQRYSYDRHNDIQHYRGERAVANDQLQAIRAKAERYDSARWADGSVPA